MCSGLLAATGVGWEGCVGASQWGGGCGLGASRSEPRCVWLLGRETGQSGMLCWHGWGSCGAPECCRGWVLCSPGAGWGVKRAGARGSCCLSARGLQRVWGDHGHPTMLLEGKWGPMVMLGSAGTGASLTCLGQTAFARVAKRAQLVVRRRKVGLEQGVEMLAGILEKTGVLWQDSAEGTAVLPQHPCIAARAGRSLGCRLFLLPARQLARWCSPRCAWVLPRSRSSSSSSKHSVVARRFLPRRTTAGRWVVGAQRLLLKHRFPACAGGPLSCQAVERMVGRAPSRIQLRVAMGVGWVMGRQLRPWDVKRLAEVAGGGRI